MHTFRAKKNVDRIIEIAELMQAYIERMIANRERNDYEAVLKLAREIEFVNYEIINDCQNESEQR